MDIERLQILFDRYLDQSAGREEEEELMHLLEDPVNEEPVKNIVDACWEKWRAEHLLTESRSEALYHTIVQQLAATPGSRSRKIVRLSWQRVAAAAAVIILLGAGTYALVQNIFTRRDDDEISTTKPSVHDIAAPSSAHAVLTLANGTKVVLDSLQSGSLGKQGNAKIIKLANGQIAYRASGNQAKDVLYNTLTVPRGSKIMQLTLADGSRVWLNSASSLRYPAAFTGRERKVEITGEAYFEIADNAAKPFIITAGKMQVQVLGTHFNINAYTDEQVISTTLLQGSIKIIRGNKVQVLAPGEQARVNAQGQIKLVENANTEEAIAWKNGFFSFHEADIREVMRQLARWYDVDVSYEGDIPPGTFSGEIGRDLSLQKVFAILKKTRVNFKLEADKKIIIMP